MKQEIIPRRRISEEVARRLEARILAGEFAPGDKLPSERELMELYGVGRPAVREALYSLKKMGLVGISSGERARVTRPTPSTVIKELSGAVRHFLVHPDGTRHFQEIRLLFEVALARDAAMHATAADVRRFEEVLAANKKALGNLEEFIQTDIAFHFVLAEITKNPIITAIHEAIVEWLRSQRVTALLVGGADLAAYRDHQAIYEAVAARDPDRAEREMRDHLGLVAANYWKGRGERERSPGTAARGRRKQGAKK